MKIKRSRKISLTLLGLSTLFLSGCDNGPSLEKKQAWLLEQETKAADSLTPQDKEVQSGSTTTGTPEEKAAWEQESRERGYRDDPRLPWWVYWMIFNSLMSPYNMYTGFRAVPLIESSWEKDERSLYGRIDFSYNPSLSENPKFLEYNGDTPTGLLEAAVIQWFWLTDRFQTELDRKQIDQFNSIHESLIDTWKLIGSGSAKVHFTGCSDVPEDHQTLLYLGDTASQAGKEVELIDISRIGWNGSLRRFLGETDPLDAAFKLYP